MDDQYYIIKLEEIFKIALSENKKFALSDYIIFNKDVILQVAKSGALTNALELVSAFLLKLPPNCKLQNDLMKLMHEYFNDSERNID